MAAAREAGDVFSQPGWLTGIRNSAIARIGILKVGLVSCASASNIKSWPPARHYMRREWIRLRMERWT